MLNYKLPPSLHLTHCHLCSASLVCFRFVLFLIFFSIVQEIKRILSCNRRLPQVSCDTIDLCSASESSAYMAQYKLFYLLTYERTNERAEKFLLKI